MLEITINIILEMMIIIMIFTLPSPRVVACRPYLSQTLAAEQVDITVIIIITITTVIININIIII